MATAPSSTAVPQARAHQGDQPATAAAVRRSGDGTTSARDQLLLRALALFADRGFAKTSTRDIAQAAGVNLAAIRYYFGDKAGLYRAVFTEPFGDPGESIARYDHDGLTLRQSLEGFFATFLEPMKQGAVAQQCMRLHLRELLEPTGLFAHELEHSIRPAHAALTRVLRRHLGLARDDDELHRLAFTLAGMAMHLFVGRDIVDALRPALLRTDRAIDRWALRLADFGCALVAAEAARRGVAMPILPAAATATAAP